MKIGNRFDKDFARRFGLGLLSVLIVSSCTDVTGETAQTVPKLSDSVAPYVSVNEAHVLLTNALLHRGDGSTAKSGQSILLSGKYIIQTGADGTLDVPPGAHIINVDGGSVMPGIIGMHNHTHMPGKPLLKYIGPRLYLAGGVTTMTTAGSANTLGELEMASSIRDGTVPGPTIFPSAHYITGQDGNASMRKPETEEAARVFVQSWARRGVSWFKLYRHTEPHIARAVIDEAHQLGLKVTGHLCSITFSEAAEFGIDSLEHGLNAATDFVDDKPTGKCVGSRRSKLSLQPDDPAVQALIQTLVEHDVTLTATPAILETGFPHRPQGDTRSLALMTPARREAYQARQTRLADIKDTTTSTPSYWTLLQGFEQAFVAAGGHLVAGPDTGRHIYPGYGDQRNFELLTEAGFSVDETIKIMTLNGAKTLGVDGETGIIAPGFEADILVLGKSLYTETSNIRDVEYVFKDGVGYDPDKLIEDVMTYVHGE